jgi:4,5-DOPA dioxygenase extradiol
VTTQLMPAAFVGHGTPMNALEHNHYTEAWQAFATSFPRPRAVLVVSAHWFINATAVTAMAAPRTIHDFYGFPPELFAVEYPAPGSLEVAEEVAQVVHPTWVGLDHDSWGLDHGTWSILRHMYPEADVPVLQLSINADQPLDYHVAVGASLAPLRERGVLVLGSGNVVHNLRRIDPGRGEIGFDWAQRFDTDARSIMTTDPAAMAGLQSHADYRLAVPTPDHFIPVLYLAGLAAAAGTPTDALVDGYVYGSLSMISSTLGANAGPIAAGTADADALGALPDPAVVPPEDTNI